MLSQLWSWLENTSLALRIGESFWFPLLESVHVVAVVLVVGSILMVDLRLLGVAARSYTVDRMTRELVPWSWLGFALAIFTGVGLFMTRASHYADNSAFRAKVALLVFAGANVALFHFRIFRNAVRPDVGGATPGAAKLSAGLSLLLWSGVVLTGRWVGHLS